MTSSTHYTRKSQANLERINNLLQFLQALNLFIINNVFSVRLELTYPPFRDLGNLYSNEKSKNILVVFYPSDNLRKFKKRYEYLHLENSKQIIYV